MSPLFRPFLSSEAWPLVFASKRVTALSFSVQSRTSEKESVMFIKTAEGWKRIIPAERVYPGIKEFLEREEHINNCWC